jgi:glycosyltransferase involved in cell wall biosynthesis
VSRLRVLHVIAGLSARHGGPPSVVVNASLALRDCGCTSSIFTTDLAQPASSRTQSRVVQKDLPRGAEELDVRIFRAAQPMRVAFAPELASALRTAVTEYDVLHIHSLFLYPQLVAFRAATRARLPFVVSPHGALAPILRHRNHSAKELCSRLWQRRMLERAAVVHYATEAERDLASDLGLRSQSMVVPHGIGWDEFQRNGDDARFRASHLGGFAGPFVLAFGRLSHLKGFDLLIRAFALLPHADARLVVAGPDDEGLQPALEFLAAEEGIVNRVAFIGPLRDQDRLAALTSASLCAFPSKTENFGNAVLEAMAAGRPVVVSPQVGLAHDIEQAGAGLVVERTAETFADAMTSLLDRRSRRTAMGRRARRFAQRYDWRAIAPQLLEMYAATTTEPQPLPKALRRRSRVTERAADE